MIQSMRQLSCRVNLRTSCWYRQFHSIPREATQTFSVAAIVNAAGSNVMFCNRIEIYEIIEIVSLNLENANSALSLHRSSWDRLLECSAFNHKQWWICNACKFLFILRLQRLMSFLNLWPFTRSVALNGARWSRARAFCLLLNCMLQLFMHRSRTRSGFLVACWAINNCKLFCFAINSFLNWIYM